jgi:hypothetical protein
MREEMRMVTRKRTGMRTSNLRRAYFTKTDVLSFEFGYVRPERNEALSGRQP